MAYTKKLTIALVTVADGSCTAYSEVASGDVQQIRYKPGTLDTGTDITMTAEDSGVAVWAESNLGTSNITRVPQQAAHTTVGVAATLDGTRPMLVPIRLSNERIKVILAQGGNVLTGSVEILMG